MSESIFSLKGKRTMVTGGSRGMGAACSLLLAECGADVCEGCVARAALKQMRW